MANKLVMMLLTVDPDQPHVCGSPFFHAAAAASMDVDVEVYFASRAVRLLLKGVADQLYPGEGRTKSVYHFMQDAAKLGVKFYACGGGFSSLGVEGNDDFIAEFSGIAGATAYIQRVMDDEWKTITY